MCVSVSAEWQCGNGFTPEVRFLQLSIYILAKGILFRKRERRDSDGENSSRKGIDVGIDVFNKI